MIYLPVFLIILSVFLIFLTVYLFKNTELQFPKVDQGDFNGSKDPTELKLSSDTFIDSGVVHVIFSSDNKTPIAKVPLRAFKSPMLKYIFVDSFPAFFRYKNEFLQQDTDQGLCGSCWVFSVASVLADKVSLYSNGVIKKRLSVQQLLSCYPNDKKGCEGDSPDDLALWLDKNRTQIKTEGDYPYEQKSSIIVQTECPIQFSGVKVLPKSVRTITTFVDEKPYPSLTSVEKSTIAENVKRMKQELLTKGPIYSAISVRQNFYEYDGNSVYTTNVDSQNAIGGHSIEIIGYCEKGLDHRGLNLNSSGYWICKNYWSNWPLKTQNGLFALEMGINNCGIESRCGTLEPENKYNSKIHSNTFYNTPEIFHNYNRFSF
jgi:hypothetical protein